MLAINSHSALFSILGTTYGGDGRSTFGLPDLRGRVAMHAGTGSGLTPRNLGAKSGTETNTISTSQMPSHKHTGAVQVNTEASTSTEGGDHSFGTTPSTAPFFNTQPGEERMLNSSIAIDNAGGGQPVNNIQPFQVVNFIIALQGTYPSRS